MPDVHTKWIGSDGAWDAATSWSNGIPNTSDHIASLEPGSGTAPTTGLNTTSVIKELRIARGFKYPIGGLGNPLTIGIINRLTHLGSRRLHWKYYDDGTSPLATIMIASPDGADIDSTTTALFVAARFVVLGGRIALLPNVTIAAGSFGGAQAGDGPGLIIDPRIHPASVISQATSITSVFVAGGGFEQIAGSPPGQIQLVEGRVTLIGSLADTHVWQEGGRFRWEGTPAAELERLYLTGGTFDATAGSPNIVISSGIVKRPGRLVIAEVATNGTTDVDRLGF